MDAVTTVFLNSPELHELNGDCFLGKLQEGHWSEEHFSALESALKEIAPNELRRTLAYHVFLIFNRSIVLLNSHMNPNDGFKLRDGGLFDVLELRDRLEICFKSFFRQLAVGD